MRRSVVFVLLVGLAGLLSLPARAADADIQITDAIARAMPKVAPTSAIFLTLHNSSGKARVLVAASSSAAQAVELHTHTMKDGMMQMRRVKEIRIPAGESVVFQPGGLHIMLIGLNQDLKAGEHIDLTLTYADGQSQSLTVPVGQPKMGGMGHMQHMDHMGGDMGNMQHMQH